MYEIYHISHPKTQQIAYVGMSKDAKRRFKEHIRREGGQVYAWAQKLAREEGVSPLLTIIETTESREQAAAREKYWIEELCKSHALLNFNFNHRSYEERQDFEAGIADLFKDCEATEAKELTRLTIKGIDNYGHSAWDYQLDITSFTIDILEQAGLLTRPLTDIEIAKIVHIMHGDESEALP